MAAVLLVDDDAEVLKTLATILERVGHSVATAANGMKALDILDEGKPLDLLITDVMMPGLNGFNLSRMARSRRPSMKVLYLTGYHEQALAMRDQGERLGKLLTKPIFPDDLRREVAEALGG